MQALIDSGALETTLEFFIPALVRMPNQELAAYRQLPVWKVRVQLAPTIPREMVFDHTYTFAPQKYSGMHTPTLLLLGGDSPPLFQRAIATLEAALPNSRVVVMPGEQHIAMDTNPDLFIAEVLKSLLE